MLSCVLASLFWNLVQLRRDSKAAEGAGQFQSVEIIYQELPSNECIDRTYIRKFELPATINDFRIVVLEIFAPLNFPSLSIVSLRRRPSTYRSESSRFAITGGKAMQLPAAFVHVCLAILSTYLPPKIESTQTILCHASAAQPSPDKIR